MLFYWKCLAWFYRDFTSCLFELVLLTCLTLLLTVGISNITVNLIKIRNMYYKFLSTHNIIMLHCQIFSFDDAPPRLRVEIIPLDRILVAICLPIPLLLHPHSHTHQPRPPLLAAPPLLLPVPWRTILNVQVPAWPLHLVVFWSTPSLTTRISLVSNNLWRRESALVKAQLTWIPLSLKLS